MNNSFLKTESTPIALENVEPTQQLEEREAVLRSLIEAISTIRSSQEWRTLKKLVLDGKVESLTRELLSEARSDTPNQCKLAKLAGELRWAERFSDLEKLEALYRTEITKIKTKLHGKTPKNPGVREPI